MKRNEVRPAPLALATLATLAVLAGPAEAAAQRAGGGAAGRAADTIGTPHYDVVVEVPRLRVDSIGLRVDSLRAHLALDGNVVNLVQVRAGADVGIGRVELDLTGVSAEAYLYVDLDNVARIVDRVVRTLESNPELIEELLATVDTAVSTVGGVAGAALRPGGAVDRTVDAVGRTLENVTAPNGILSSVVDAAGRTVQRTVTTAGGLVERTLDTAGNVLGSRSLGSLTDLPVVNQTTDAAGRTVRTVRDQSGRLIEYTLDAAGAITNVRVR